MTNDTYRKLIEEMQRQMEPLTALQNSLGGQSGVARLVEDMTRKHDLLRTAYGPMEELRQSGALATLTQQGGAIQQVYKQMEAAHKRFALPEVTTATKLLEEFQNGPASTLAVQFLAERDAITRATEAMQTPWLDTANQLRSVRAFADLQGIGLALRTMPSFGDQFTDLLRDELGDWRDKIAWPERIFGDAAARTMFYEERGLDPALTAFPAGAFKQSLNIAGLRPAPPELVELYDYEEVVEEGEGEEAFARNNAAHDRLQRFESQLRQFIDEKMIRAFGDQWIKHRVPGSIRKSWIKKREKARANGERDQPLLAYADFSDYAQIITQKNNWNDVFKPIFGRQTSVQESLQRLYPIRICTMHARMITQDDELYLHVETRRILIAIGAG